MLSSEPESLMKAAGHGPAKRVGNMRIKVYKRQTSKEPIHSKGSESDEGADELCMSPPKPQPIVSSQNKGDADFQADAIRSFHEKPFTHAELRSQHRANIIQQPKKF